MGFWKSLPGGADNNAAGENDAAERRHEEERRNFDLLKYGGSNAMACHLEAQACLGKGDMVGGIARLTKAIALAPQMGDARLLRAQTLMAMGDLKGAQDDARWLLEHAGDQEDVLLLAARLAHAGGDDDEALLLYNKVADQNPFLADAYRERGKIRYDRGDKAGAQEDMQRVLELDPQTLDGVSGNYEAEGIEQQTRRAYSMLNPFGI